MIPLRLILVMLCLLAAVYYWSELGASTRHWVAAAQPPAACAPVQP